MHVIVIKALRIIAVKSTYKLENNWYVHEFKKIMILHSSIWYTVNHTSYLLCLILSHKMHNERKTYYIFVEYDLCLPKCGVVEWFKIVS